tara:strand:- start:217 stop:363 length:147 start_codon:yes stop_codon:yes gene_type:complete
MKANKIRIIFARGMAYELSMKEASSSMRLQKNKNNGTDINGEIILKRI